MYRYKGEELLSSDANAIAHVVTAHAENLGLNEIEQQVCINAAIAARYRGASCDQAVEAGKGEAALIRMDKSYDFDTETLSERRARLAVAFAIIVAIAAVVASYHPVHP